MTQQEHLSTHLQTVTRGVVYLIAFFLPLVFFPWTTDPLEMNKQTFFVLLTCVAALCWIGSQMVQRKVEIKRGWINILPMLFVLAFLIPSWFSSSPYISWIGSNRQEYTSALTALAGTVLFYVVMNTFHKRAHHQLIHSVLLFSTILVGILGLFSFLGINIFPSPLSEIMAFNTVGTVNLFGVYLIVMTIFSLAVWISHKHGDSLLHDGFIGFLEQIAAIFLGFLTFFVIMLADYSQLWILLIVGLGLLLTLAFFRSESFENTGRFWFLVILLVCALPFWFWLSSPVTADLPIEVSLNHEASMEIAQQALHTSSSYLGSGPGTYTFAFGKFHDVALNETDFWSTRFDRASSYVLTLLPTVGYVGLGLLAIFCLVLVIAALQGILRPRTSEVWLEQVVHTAPWVTLVFSACLFSWNMTLVGMFFLFSALLASQFLRAPTSRSFTKSPGQGLVFSVFFLALTLVFFVGIFVTSQRYSAEIAFAQAIELDQSGGDLQQIVQDLDRAATLNRFNDTYYRNLATALLLRVDEQLYGISGIDALTTESQAYLQSLIAASINAAVRATDLSPENALNWLVQGMVYREIADLDSSAVGFAIDAYLKAVEKEPVNPSHWTELGKTYLVASKFLEPLTVSQDAETVTQARADRDLALTSAESSFTRAIELKSNYAPAHFQLGVTYELQGRLDEAIGKLESVAKYNQLDVGVHFELGLLYLQRKGIGDIDRAQIVFETAVGLLPSYSNARWILAYVYEIQDNITEAIEQVEAVLELNPDNVVIQNRLHRLLRGELENTIPETLEMIEL